MFALLSLLEKPGETIDFRGLPCCPESICIMDFFRKLTIKINHLKSIKIKRHGSLYSTVYYLETESENVDLLDFGEFKFNPTTGIIKSEKGAFTLQPMERAVLGIAAQLHQNGQSLFGSRDIANALYNITDANRDKCACILGCVRRIRQRTQKLELSSDIIVTVPHQKYKLGLVPKF